MGLLQYIAAITYLVVQGLKLLLKMTCNLKLIFAICRGTFVCNVMVTYERYYRCLYPFCATEMRGAFPREIFSDVSCSDVYFLTHPSSVVLPDVESFSLSDKQLLDANKYVLGLSAKASAVWRSGGDFFHRPRAIAIGTAG